MKKTITLALQYKCNSIKFVKETLHFLKKIISPILTKIETFNGSSNAENFSPLFLVDKFSVGIFALCWTIFSIF